MKILAVSDEVVELIYSPRIKDRYGDVDLVLACGDLPGYYLEFIVSVLDVPLYYVPGNHDRTTRYLDDGRALHRAEGCESLDVRSARCAVRSPLLLAGLGGSLRYNLEGVYQYTQQEMWARALALAPALAANRLRFGGYLDILITHAPPRGIHDGPDLAHTGFDAFLRVMDIFKPRLLLHGHTHVYGTGVVTATRYKETSVLNVYPSRVIEWKSD